MIRQRMGTLKYRVRSSSSGSGVVGNVGSVGIGIQMEGVDIASQARLHRRLCMAASEVSIVMRDTGQGCCVFALDRHDW